MIEHMPRKKFTPERIRQLRTKLGMTQKECGVFIEVATSTISRWENGRYKPSRHVERNLERAAQAA